MSWLILTVLAIVARASFGLSTKVLSSRAPVSAITQSMLMTTGAMVFGLLLSPFVGGISAEGLAEMWPTVILMMAAATAGGIFYLKGQKYLDAGTMQIAFSSVLIWGMLLSVGILGSQFWLVQLTGTILLMAAIVYVQYRKDTRIMSRAIVYVVVAAAFLAVFQVMSARLAPHITTGTYLVLAFGGPAVITMLLYGRIIYRELKALQSHDMRQTTGATVFAAAMSVAYYMLAYLAYEAAADPGVVVLMLTTQVILAVVLGIIFLKERDNVPRKLGAAVMAVVAGLLIKS